MGSGAKVLARWQEKGRTYELLPKERGDKLHALRISEDGYSTILHRVMPDAVSRHLIQLHGVLGEFAVLDHEEYDDDCETVYMPRDTWNEIRSLAGIEEAPRK